MIQSLVLTVVAFQLAQCPRKTDAPSTDSSGAGVQKQTESKRKLTIVFAPPSSDEPYAVFGLRLHQDGSLDTLRQRIPLFDPKAKASERKKQLLDVSELLKKDKDGVYRLDIYLETAKTPYANVVKTLAELRAAIEPALAGDAIICIRLSETLK